VPNLSRSAVLDLAQFSNLPLEGGFTLAEVRLSAEPLLDPLNRDATAQPTIRGKRFRTMLSAGMEGRELSLSLYHEVLETATVAAETPPHAALEFNEGAFERAARRAHEQLGFATPRTLNQMLIEYGF
jgi:hypothetical protein